MEIQHLKKDRVRVVNALSAFTLMLSLLCCASQVHGPVDTGKYDITKHKSVSGSTYLTLEAFESKNPANRFHAAYQVNKIIFVPDRVGSFTLHVLEGDFSIKAGAVSKKWVEINKLTISKGDSLHLKIYLENDPQPLRE
jgi:hypothetical protein